MTDTEQDKHDHYPRFWHIPTMPEIKVAAIETQTSRREMADSLGLSCPEQVLDQHLSMANRRKALEVLAENGSRWAVEVTMPTLGMVDEAREERGITMQTMSALVYESARGFANVVKQGTASVKAIQRMVRALRLYDYHGIIPLPEEVKDIE
jgi:hypothetical protein